MWNNKRSHYITLRFYHFILRSCVPVSICLYIINLTYYTYNMFDIYSINNPDIRVTDYDVDMTCKNGSFSWNYPLGTIILHFQGKTSFSVCFRDELGADHLEISDVTEGADRRFPAFHRYDRGKTKLFLWHHVYRVDKPFPSFQSWQNIRMS